MKNKLLLVYGTRPEYLKLKPLIEELKNEKINFKVLFTGQHVDIGQFGYDYSFNIDNVGINRLDIIVKSVMDKLSYIEGITHVLVQGDTTTALAITLSAFHNKLQVIHLEAGLRTYDVDNPYPEETNRRLISIISNINFCPTENNYQNLINEMCLNDCYVVGNTVIDNLISYKEKCCYENKVLITLHRRENHDTIIEWFNVINELAKLHPELEFILPIHPNPKVRDYSYILTNVNVIQPLNHDDLLELLVKCKMVITDSGGIQEECSFFNKKCLTCRITTERPEAIGMSTILIQKPDELINIFQKEINDYVINYECPYGTGNTSKKIVNILKSNYNF
jgi:UDP-N-acetylglucosamine 2-epimerase (non-hydrolysing)